MFSVLPFSERRLVNPEHFPAFDHRELQVEPTLFDMFSDMAGICGILVMFPQVIDIARLTCN
jgi:hypothetical protein